MTGDSAVPTLTVVIPVFNEITTIARLLARVEAVPIDKEILLVDDGSTDGTTEALQGLAADRGYRVLVHSKNQGKGAALRTGFAAARGRIVIVQDGDLEYDPAEYPKLVAPILDGRADVVYGSRFTGGESHRVLHFWHYTMNQFLTFVSNCFSNLFLTDMETCYKVFRRDVLESIVIEENRFGFEPEITAKVAALGCRVYEVAIGYEGRAYAAGKKIGWRDGVRALWCIVKYNLRSRKGPIPPVTTPASSP
ncbi:MAG: glycosyltransferase family 2 protein [Gemmatimonadota bacterium]